MLMTAHALIRSNLDTERWDCLVMDNAFRGVKKENKQSSTQTTTASRRRPTQRRPSAPATQSENCASV